jgi:hypothetical protein
MQIQTVLDIAAGVADIDGELWVLIRDESIPSEDSRAKMLREAMRWQFICGAANRHEDLREAKMLVAFLRSAPLGESVSDVAVSVDGVYAGAV